MLTILKTELKWLIRLDHAVLWKLLEQLQMLFKLKIKMFKFQKNNQKKFWIKKSMMK